MKEIVQELVKLADCLDEYGLRKEADTVDDLLAKYADSGIPEYAQGVSVISGKNFKYLGNDSEGVAYTIYRGADGIDESDTYLIRAYHLSADIEGANYTKIDINPPNEYAGMNAGFAWKQADEAVRNYCRRNRIQLDSQTRNKERKKEHARKQRKLDIEKENPKAVACTRVSK